MDEYRIYVGLKDSDSREQKFDTEKYLNILKHVCRSYHVPFSVSVSNGGYFHADGSYVDETTLVLTLLDVEHGIVGDIAKDLCTFFHQESVLVSRNPVDVLYIAGEQLAD